MVHLLTVCTGNICRSPYAERYLQRNLDDVAPGPLVRTSEQLVDALANLDTVRAEYADRYAAFQRTFSCLEDGSATDRVLDLLFRSGLGSGFGMASAPLVINGKA